ncbi:MAG TPA: PAS domain S-box protein [Nitrospirota bacterium]
MWRYYNDKLLIQNVSLEYDLSQDKEQLEKHTHNLEGLVAERTRELSESVQWHRSLFENATDGIVILDKNGAILNANQKACDMHGFTRETLVGTHIRLLEKDEPGRGRMADFMRQLLDGESCVFETRHNKKDGSTIDLEVSAKAISVGDELLIQAFYRDITERKRLQEHMFQSQKMDSIGVLAGGIAHDFNNILTAILGHAEIIRRNSVLEVKSTNSLGVIEDASRRAGRMITKLLGFARKSKYEIVPLNVNDVVYDTIKLLERVVDKTAEMSVELDSRLPLIHADANQVEQIVMNLIINARDAMPKGGKISIKTTEVNVQRGMPEIPAYIVPGAYVVLTISDTGAGIPKEVVGKIFEPFFTTKERGKGTGPGLSMVYGAVKEHKGYITVASEVGSGTIFTIYLPASPASSSAAASAAKDEVASLSSDETVLIVDDDEELLHAVQDALSSRGYKTVPVSSSTNALSIFQKIPQEIALVITDIAMPQMDGKELIRKIKETKPEIKIIAMSGHEKYIADKDGIREIDGFMKKPFESAYLLAVVRRILDAKTRTALTI